MFLCVLLVCAVGVTSASTPGKSSVRKWRTLKPITTLLLCRKACYVLFTKLNMWVTNYDICLSVCLWLYSTSEPWPLFQFRNLYTVGRTLWTGDQPTTRPLHTHTPTHRTTQTQNKRTKTDIPRVGFEPRIPVLEWVKMVHALDRVATVIGTNYDISSEYHLNTTKK
jgi:hypothetical protein